MNLSEFQHAIESMQKHDLAALEKIYQDYFKKIYALALYKIKEDQDAYDIAMSIMIKLSKYKGNARDIKNHIGLMIAMTQNAVTDYYRRQKCISVHEYNDALQASVSDDALWFTDIMNVLTEVERSVFIDHIIWEKKLKKIAEERGKSYISVRRIYKAVKRKILEIYKE